MIKWALQFQRKSNQHCPKSLFYNYYSQIKSNRMSNVVFFVRGENRVPGEKLLIAEQRTNKQTQSTYETERGNQTQAALVQGKCSHHQTNPATINNILSYQLIMFQKAYMYPEDGLSRIQPLHENQVFWTLYHNYNTQKHQYIRQLT